MRIAFAGSRTFGVEALREVLRLGHEVPVVFTHRDDKLAPFAELECRIPVVEKVNPADIRAADVDLILAVHTFDFIGRKSRAASNLGALVGHPSLLPRHRGRSSVEWTVKMRDPIAGFTYFWADDGVDTGPVAAQDWCHVDPQWTASDLWREQLFPMGVRLLHPTLRRIERDGHFGSWHPQDERFATVEPAIESKRLYRPELIALPAGRR